MASKRTILDTTDILRDRIALTLQKSSLDLDFDIDAIVPEIEKLRRQEYENYFDEKLPVNREEAPSVEYIQEILRRISQQTGKKPAILYIIVQPEALQLVLVMPSGRPIYRRVPKADRDTLLQVVTEFRSEITDPAKRDTTSYLESAQKLYQWMFAPIEGELQAQGIQTVAFSLDPKLRSVSLAVLHDGQQFLVEKYSIGLIPSVNLIDTRYRNIRNSQVLAMGASQFPNSNLESLPAVPVELTTIAKNIWQGKYFLNQDFTLANLQSQSIGGKFPIIHLATHGNFQRGEPNKSYIQLWKEQITLDRLRQLRWNNAPVELLVLSACRTAFGDENAELGFGGLAVASGVKSALASLWYVSDQGTLGLMTEFYEQLRTAPIKAEALRQAQIGMIRGTVRIEGGKLRGVTSAAEGITLPPELASQGDLKPSHPFYWGAFTLIGSPW